MSANTLLLNKRNVVISDTILTRAENAGEAHEANTPSQTRATKRTPPASATKNERGDASSAVGKKESRSEETSGGKPQRSSNQTVEQPPSESGENAAQQRNGVGQEDGDDDGDVWTQNQQKRLELALQQFPRTVADRWTCIARAVPGKTKVTHQLILPRNFQMKKHFSEILVVLATLICELTHARSSYKFLMEETFLGNRSSSVVDFFVFYFC